MDELPVDLSEKLEVDPEFAANEIRVVAVRLTHLPDDYDRDILQLNVILRSSRMPWIDGALVFLVYGTDGFLRETHRIFPHEGLDRSERQVLETFYDISDLARAELTFSSDDLGV